MVNVGQVLPGETLVNYVWGIEGGDRVMLKQLVRRLRQKIESNPARPVYIETVPGVGYALMVKREVGLPQNNGVKRFLLVESKRKRIIR